MTSPYRAIVALLALALSVLAYAPAAFAETTTECDGLLVGEHDNVVVPPDSACEMTRETIIKGNVYVYGSLEAIQATIGGNLWGSDAGSIFLEGETAPGEGVSVRIGGNVQIVGSSGATVLEDVIVGGDVLIHGLTGGNSYGVVRSNIRGNLQVTDNRNLGLIAVNDIGGNLQCFENTTAPISNGNTVSGSKEGQCAELTPSI